MLVSTVLQRWRQENGVITVTVIVCCAFGSRQLLPAHIWLLKQKIISFW